MLGINRWLYVSLPAEKREFARLLRRYCYLAVTESGDCAAGIRTGRSPV